MCGFAGVLSLQSGDHGDEIISRMNEAIAHRGPDDAGIWSDREAGISLGHRRLSIIDLSPAGHQPMHSAGGRYVIAYNGEIYNHNDLRQELENSGNAPDWRGHSDTETLLAYIEVWGIEKTLQKSIGMFTLALWDRKKSALFLARDRLGEKPLYYGWQGNTLLFASELKALKAHPAFSTEIDRDALALLMRHNYIPAPYSIYKGIKKLKAGTILRLDRKDSLSRAGSLPEPEPYWNLSEIVGLSVKNPFTGNDSEAVEMLDSLLLDAVGQQMTADVPLGAFLSGGIDSSSIVALMQAQSKQPVKTFTIGFDEKGYNEAVHAKAVARHLGTEHTELYISPDDALNVIPRLPSLYCEPFSDSSQIPTFLVSQMTREHVSVSLSGDAGDELFGGYNRYFWANRIWNKLKMFPTPIRKAMAQGLRYMSAERWDSMYNAIEGLLPASARITNPGDKTHKLAEILTAGSAEAIYHRLVSHWKQPEEIVINASEPSTILTDRTDWPDFSDFNHLMMYLDTMSYLPDDILTKVDRAAMGVSLETRVPFLDHRVVEFAWKLPLHMKIRDGQGKWILRQVLERYVPRELTERPKMGFGVPIDSWLRGPLREWAEELLDETRLRNEGYFNPAPIRQKWQEHLSGQRNWQYHLWDVLMFQAWLEAEIK